uniref:G-protein coupled receptors family 1 profile domain-containing protein n=1 Tax=Catagonus wagneri TaxID=51154 RepID=A0A8C4FDX4_9CETA
INNNITKFILLGLAQRKRIKNMCFLLPLWCYIAIWMGNLIIMISITYSQLNGQPMYFFINYLALLDLCYTSTVTSKLVTDSLSKSNKISYTSCMARLFAMHFFGGIEVFSLTTMAYFQYVAICKPLHYTVIMNRQRCYAIVGACCAGAFLHSSAQCLLTITLPFYGPNETNHYFCDVYPLLRLVCTKTYRVRILVVANSDMICLVTFVVVMLSYFLILYTIKAYTAESHTKALSTCSSHILVVVLFFVPVLFIHIRPATTLLEDKVFALFYTIIAPMCNPLIYTLGNTEMKNALRKLHKIYSY